MVKVYWNSRKKIFSVLNGKNPVFHTKAISLNNVRFKVSKSGREKVLKTNIKGVHAFVCGDFTTNWVDVSNEFTYNPFKHECFVDRKTGAKLDTCKQVYLYTEDGKPLCFYA